MSSKEWNNSLNNITPEWFKLTNKALIEGNLKHPNRRRIYVHKVKSSGMRPITISSPRVKVIEKALLNALEPYFEGVWEWEKSSEKKVKDLLQNNLIQVSDYKRNKKGWFKKNGFNHEFFSYRVTGFLKVGLFIQH